MLFLECLERQVEAASAESASWGLRRLFPGEGRGGGAGSLFEPCYSRSRSGESVDRFRGFGKVGPLMTTTA